MGLKPGREGRARGDVGTKPVPDLPEWFEAPVVVLSTDPSVFWIFEGFGREDTDRGRERKVLLPSSKGSLSVDKGRKLGVLVFELISVPIVEVGYLDNPFLVDIGPPIAGVFDDVDNVDKMDDVDDVGFGRGGKLAVVFPGTPLLLMEENGRLRFEGPDG